MSALGGLGLVVHGGPVRRIAVARRQANVPPSDFVQLGGSGAQHDTLEIVKVGCNQRETEVDGRVVGGHPNSVSGQNGTMTDGGSLAF